MDTTVYQYVYDPQVNDSLNFIIRQNNFLIDMLVWFYVSAFAVGVIYLLWRFFKWHFPLKGGRL